MYVEVKISPRIKKYSYEGLREIILEMGERLHEWCYTTHVTNKFSQSTYQILQMGVTLVFSP